MSLPMSQAHCPSCGYTEQDAKIHMDHQLCNNAGRAPWEKHIGRGTITLTGEEYDAVKQRARVQALEEAINLFSVNGARCHPVGIRAAIRNLIERERKP